MPLQPASAGDYEAILKFEVEADNLGEINDVKLYTILHTESWQGNTEHVRFILSKFENSDILFKLDEKSQTALHYAAYSRHPQVVEVLIDAAREAFSSYSFEAFFRQANRDMDTALSHAVIQGNLPTVKLLVEADSRDRHIQNHQCKTPIYIAAKNG